MCWKTIYSNVIWNKNFQTTPNLLILI